MKEQMPEVLRCEAKECAFNNGLYCSATAITIGGPEDICPRCDTFFQMLQKGGNKNVAAGVGACKVRLCAFNKAFGCTARGVRVKLHDGHAECATYQAR
jgi:hypothetical protein